MTSKRWYPTAQLLPDGRTLVVGGANVFGNLIMNSMHDNNPTYEFWPRARGERSHPLAMLTDPSTVPFALYPFVHVMASGLVYIFAGQKSVLLNYQTNQVRVPGMMLPVGGSV